MRRWVRRGARVAAAIVGLTAVALLAVTAFWREPRWLTLTVEEVRTPAWPAKVADLRVVLLSDVHIDRVHMRPERVAAIVRAANALRPDVILLAGDYVGGHTPRELRHKFPRGNWADADDPTLLRGLRELGGLKARFGVKAVIGNHDCYWNCAKVAAILGQAGIDVLQNRAAKLDRREGDVWIAGLDDAQTQRPDFAEATRGVPPGAAVIALAHNPGVFDWSGDHFPIVLAGHTHGGQVRLPWLGAVDRASRHTEDAFAHPLVRGGRVLVVSRGLGESGLPVRFGAPPEIMLITLGHGDGVRVQGPE